MPTQAYNFRTTPASTAVVEEVAARRDVDVTAVDEPLGDAIDPDALDTFVENLAAGGESGRVGFSFAGCFVTVHSDGHVDLEESE